MKPWVYYLDQAASGVFMLYRVREDLSDPERRFRQDGQVYNRSKGWIPDKDLIIEMNRTGFVDDDDVITEDRANALIADLRSKLDL